MTTRNPKEATMIQNAIFFTATQSIAGADTNSGFLADAPILLISAAFADEIRDIVGCAALPITD